MIILQNNFQRNIFFWNHKKTPPVNSKKKDPKCKKTQLSSNKMFHIGIQQETIASSVKPSIFNIVFFSAKHSLGEKTCTIIISQT